MQLALWPNSETTKKLENSQQKLVNWQTGRFRWSKIILANVYRNQGHYDKAEQLSLKAEETARRVFGNDHEITNASVDNLIKLYEAWDRPEKAEQWRAKLPQTEAVDQ